MSLLTDLIAAQLNIQIGFCGY